MYSQKNLKHPPHLKLKGQLAEKGIKQKELARLLGITVTTLSRKINGQAHFTVFEVNKICQEYDLSPDIFSYRV